MEQVAQLQGYNKAPKVVASEEEFVKAAKESGVVGFRTVNGAYGTGKTSEDVCNEYMYQDDIKYNYGGGQAYGEGIYVATTKQLTQQGVKDASDDSWMYGGRQMAITFTPDFKPIDSKSLSERWSKLADSTKLQYTYRAYEQSKRYGHPTDAMTTYAAALGFDAVVNDNYDCNYTVVFNRSKMIMYKETNSNRDTTNVHIEEGLE